MNERIRYLRKNVLKMNLKAFAERIGVKPDAVSKYETGRSGVSELAVRSICHEFGVSEIWLKEGKGEIFIRESTDEVMQRLSRIITDKDPDSFKKCFIEMVSLLTQEQWQLLSDMMDIFLKIRDEAEKEK